jgi:phosphoribosylformylglycinamidine cyclo-ligase
VFDVAQLDWKDEFLRSGTSIGETLLTPTLIYTKAMRQVLLHYKVKNVVHGIAHITGGGLEDNLERILPPGLDVEIDGQEWERPPVFEWLQQLGNVETEEMFRVFNMGIGLVLVVSPFYADNIRRMLTLAGHQNWQIGSVKTNVSKESRSVKVAHK